MCLNPNVNELKLACFPKEDLSLEYQTNTTVFEIHADCELQMYPSSVTIFHTCKHNLETQTNHAFLKRVLVTNYQTKTTMFENHAECEL